MQVSIQVGSLIKIKSSNGYIIHHSINPCLFVWSVVLNVYSEMRYFLQGLGSRKLLQNEFIVYCEQVRDFEQGTLKRSTCVSFVVVSREMVQRIRVKYGHHIHKKKPKSLLFSNSYHVFPQKLWITCG